MKVLSSCLAAGLLLLASVPAFAQADPLAVGTHAVLTATYDRGPAALPGCPPADGCEIPDTEVVAEVYYPSDLANGPYPLVVFLHGRHAACYNPTTGAATNFWDGGCPSGYEMIPSYRGYDYVGKLLASHGYIVASISANGINGQDGSTFNAGIYDRAYLVESHLGFFDQFNSVGSAVDPEPFASQLIGRVDMTTIGSMGHSRGGDGVATHAALFSDTSPFPVSAVLPLAPTNFLGNVVPEKDLGVLLGYCDGDVYTLEGSLFYDRSRYVVPNDESSKYTFLSLGSNHNFFNTVWTPECWTPGSCWPLTDDRGMMPLGATSDDMGPDGNLKPDDSFCDAASPTSGRLSATEQREVGAAYIAAFFRAHLGGETDLLPFLLNDVAPPGSIDPGDLHSAYQAPASDRLDLNRFETDAEFSVNTLGGAVTANSLAVYDRCGPSVLDSCFPGADREVHLTSFSGTDPTLSRARNVWDAATDSLVNALPAGSRDVSRFDTLQFRVGVDYLETSGSSSPAEFSVTLSDGGSSSTVSTNAQLGSNDLFYPPGDDTASFPYSAPITTVMSSVRLPLDLFTGVNLSNVQNVTFTYNGTTTGGILISDMAFVDEAAEPVPQPFCQASDRFIVSRAAQVTSSVAGLPAVASSGTGLTLVDEQANVSGVLSVGPVEVRQNATVNGDVRSASTTNVSPLAMVTGAVVPGAPVVLPALPTLPAFPAPVGPTINVNPGPAVTRPPGSYPTVNVNSGGTFRLSAGDYYFQTLNINTGARLEAVTGTRIFVRNTLAFRARIVTAASATQPVFLGYAGTTTLRMEAPFEGALLAPNARVAFGIGSGTAFRGTFKARILEVNPQSTIACAEGPGGGTPPAPTCADGVKNGSETDIDCGGPACVACTTGKACGVNEDCASNICTGGVCQAPPGSVTATFTVTSNWPGGYCVTLNVKNNAAVPTSSWTVGFNTAAAVMYTRWNGMFSGNFGAVNVGPVAPWNAVIPPGATNSSVGFCANRIVSGSGVLPSITSASGSF
jgi:hypothetical protein